MVVWEFLWSILYSLVMSVLAYVCVVFTIIFLIHAMELLTTAFDVEMAYSYTPFVPQRVVVTHTPAREGYEMV